MKVASSSDQICFERFLSILRKTKLIPQTGERSCHCPPSVNPLWAMSIYKDFGPMLPHLKALCNCTRDSNPTRSSMVAFKGSFLVPLQTNLDQRKTPWAHSCKSEPKSGVLPDTPSLPCDRWFPYRIVGGLLPNQWRIPRTPGSSMCPRLHSDHHKMLGTWSLSLSFAGLE